MRVVEAVNRERADTNSSGHCGAGHDDADRNCSPHVEVLEELRAENAFVSSVS